jgi:glycerophosphoryl diester phosphodiesterase
MGGGGGGGARSVGNLPKLSEEAKKALSQERRNVFISFAYEDIDEVNLLRGQSKNELSDIAFNDWSVPEPYDSSVADYIRNRIIERIMQCSATVVYVSSATPLSSWVEWEVKKSMELGKFVLAVHAGPTAPSNLPAWVHENGIKVVPWSELALALKKLK